MGTFSAHDFCMPGVGVEELPEGHSLASLGIRGVGSRHSRSLTKI